MLKFDKNKALKKWGPVIDNIIQSNKSLIMYKESISLYCEWRSSICLESGSDLAAEVRSLIDKILNTKIRYKIVGEYFNKTTGFFEYLLEDGSYVVPEDYKLDYDVYLKIFPIEFLRDWNLKDYRNKKIDNILDDEG